MSLTEVTKLPLPNIVGNNYSMWLIPSCAKYALGTLTLLNPFYQWIFLRN